MNYDLTTVAIPRDARNRLLELVGDPSALSETDSAFFHQAKHGRTLEAEGYVPTSFSHKSSEATRKIKEWIAEKTAAGYTVDFAVGEVACTSGRLSAYWHAWEDHPRFGRLSRGCIASMERPFPSPKTPIERRK